MRYLLDVGRRTPTRSRWRYRIGGTLATLDMAIELDDHLERSR